MEGHVAAWQILDAYFFLRFRNHFGMLLSAPSILGFPLSLQLPPCRGARRFTNFPSTFSMMFFFWHFFPQQGMELMGHHYKMPWCAPRNAANDYPLDISLGIASLELSVPRLPPFCDSFFTVHFRPVLFVFVAILSFGEYGFTCRSIIHRLHRDILIFTAIPSYASIAGIEFSRAVATSRACLPPA